MRNLAILTTVLAAAASATGAAAERPVQVASADVTAPVLYAQAGDTGSADAAPVEARPPGGPERVMYQPPVEGKPAQTVGGGSRGAADKIPALFAIVPDHVARTTSREPTLFWYVDRAPEPGTRIELTLHEADADEPLIETTLPAPTSAGLQRIRLADQGVRLEPGSEYEWSVALVVDPDERSKDIVVTGWIDCVDPSPELVKRLELQGEAWRAAIFAEEGVWYDAFAALSDQIDRDPQNPLLTKQRSDLLDQAGLELAAAGAGS